MFGLRSVPRQYRLLVAFSLLVPFVVFVAASLANRSSEWRTAEDTVLRTTAILDEHIRRVFETAELTLEAVDAYAQGMGWDEIRQPATNAFLQSMERKLDHVVSVWISSRDGIAQAGSEQTWSQTQSMLDRDFFAVHIDKDVGIYVSAPFRSRATGISSIAVSRRRSTADGSFDGTIHLSLKPDYFVKVFEDVAPALASVALLIREDGWILARTPSDPEFIRIGNQSALMQQIAAGRLDLGAQIITSTRYGSERLAAFRKVANYPLYVSFSINKDAIDRKWLGNVADYGFAAAGAALLLLLVSGLAIRRAQAEQVALLELGRQTEQRLEVEQKLFRAEKMQSIGQLTGGLAHDFNNLLAVVLGNVSIARRRLRHDLDVAPFLDRAIKGAERGASLTQRLLAFARQQDLTPSDVDIPGVVHSIQELLHRSLGPSISIHTDFPADLVTARADLHQLELALINLVVNARDAMPDGGIITIGAEEAELSAGEAELPAGRYVRISVFDTGVGMDEKTLAKAAEPFFTTKGVGKGTGLGLSMVQGLAAQSGGMFRLRSALGQGTTAELWLPRGEASAPPRQDAEMPAVLPEGAYRILVVDDDDLVLGSTAEMLRDCGHSPVEVPSGAEAQRVLAQQEIDLVITDHLMPGMTGLQLAEWIHQKLPSMPILLASGHADIPEQSSVPLLRLRKPFRQAELEEAVQAAVRQRPHVARLAS